MKKLNIPRRGHHAFLLFLLSMLISAFSFSQTITGILSDENNKPLVGATVTQRNVLPVTVAGLVSTPKARAN
jgi:hypothetical protein